MQRAVVEVDHGDHRNEQVHAEDTQAAVDMDVPDKAGGTSSDDEAVVAFDDVEARAEVPMDVVACLIQEQTASQLGCGA